MKNLQNPPSMLALIKMVDTLLASHAHNEVVQALLFIGTSMLRESTIPAEAKCQVIEVLHSLLHTQNTPAWQELKEGAKTPTN